MGAIDARPGVECGGKPLLRTGTLLDARTNVWAVHPGGGPFQFVTL